MSGPTLFNEDGEPLFTPERPGIVVLGDLLEYIQEMRNLYVDTQELYEVLNKNLSFIGSGSPKAVYANLAALQAAKPTGDSFIYLTTDNGNWYYWNGSAWTSGGVYQATQIPPLSISSIKVVAGKIWLINYFMDKTLKNILGNEHVALVCWKKMMGYQIKGTVSYMTEGEDFESAVAWIKSTLPDRVVMGLIILTPKEIYDVSPTKDTKEKFLVE